MSGSANAQLKGSNKTSLATLALAGYCSELNHPDCDTKLWSLTQISLFEATKYDQIKRFSLAEIFPRGFEGSLYRLMLKTARCAK